METTAPITTSQRRQIVEYVATKCVAEWPSDDMPKAEFYQDLHSEEYRLEAMRGIELVIPEDRWNDCVYWLLRAQAFDRDPDGSIEQWGYERNSPEQVKYHLDDQVSAAIDQAARFK
jgi:hypothetical protein